MNPLHTLLALLIISSCGGGGGSSASAPDNTGDDGGGGGGGPLGSISISGCSDEITASFLDISLAPGPGSSYTVMPNVSISCTDTQLSITSNAIPHYTYIATTPNALNEANLSKSITLNPEIASDITLIGNPNNGANVQLGYLGFTNTGLPWYGPTEAAQPAQEAYGDAIYNAVLGNCGGHTSPNSFHEHTLIEICFRVEGLVAEPWTLGLDETVPSGLVGYAADGFKVYGQWEYPDGDSSQALTQLQSSYTLISGQSPQSYAFEAYQYNESLHSGSTQYLDRCNGHQHADGSQYHYHITPATFPYIIGCFKGTPSAPGGG